MATQTDQSPLASHTCVPCRGDTPALTTEQQTPLLASLVGWKIEDEQRLMRDFSFSNFLEALEFTNRAGSIAEEQGHHPEITVGWGHAKVVIWTHKINGLTENDFILAAKLNQIEKSS